MGTLVQEKVDQAIYILNEKKIGLWLTIERGGQGNRDPVLPLILGGELTSTSAFLLTSSGERYAIVGMGDVEMVSRTNAYTVVIPYRNVIWRSLLHTMERIYPYKIAINYSLRDPFADGLNYGLYQLLLENFDSTPWIQRLVSAEDTIRTLRGRKTPSELAFIRAATVIAEKIINQTVEQALPGMTIMQIEAYMRERMAENGVEEVINRPDKLYAKTWSTPDSITPGQILNLPIGVRQEGFCSCLQRVIYYLKEGEKNPPSQVQHAFVTVRTALHEAAKALKPGISGTEVDSIARKVIIQNGFAEPPGASGFQLGRFPDDGYGIIGPAWERYHERASTDVEAGQVYSLVQSVEVTGYGCLGLKEIVRVTETGVEFLTNPQTELLVK